MKHVCHDLKSEGWQLQNQIYQITKLSINIRLFASIFTMKELGILHPY